TRLDPGCADLFVLCRALRRGPHCRFGQGLNGRSYDSTACASGGSADSMAWTTSDRADRPPCQAPPRRNLTPYEVSRRQTTSHCCNFGCDGTSASPKRPPTSMSTSITILAPPGATSMTAQSCLVTPSSVVIQAVRPFICRRGSRWTFLRPCTVLVPSVVA